jgi:hypothetical protein
MPQQQASHPSAQTMNAPAPAPRKPKSFYAWIGGGLASFFVLVAFSLGMDAAGYYWSLWSDTRARPWAYSFNDSKPLLVGQWQGTFVDSDAIRKTITVEIVVPKTEEERRRQTHARSRSNGWGNTPSPTAFKGSAKIVSAVETNNYGVTGELDDDSIFEFTMRFEDRDGKRSTRSFTVFKVESGNWKENEMKLELGFAERGAEGGLILQSKRLPRGSGRQILKEEKGPMVMTDTTIVKRIPVVLRRVAGA